MSERHEHRHLDAPPLPRRRDFEKVRLHGQPVPCSPLAVKVCVDPNSIAVGLVLVFAVFYAVSRYFLGKRARELFVLEVRNGQVRTARGKPPARLVHDFQDVVEKPPVKRATLTVVVDGDRPRLLVEGKLDEFRIQRLRNVLGLFPLAKLR